MRFTRKIELGERIRCAKYAVKGFWSDDYVEVWQTKTLMGKVQKCNISWSCGGADGNEVSEVTKARNLSAALADAADLAQEWNRNRNWSVP